ncbi:hypothetical protein AVEN_128320-1 [Araneus ventricosus]|uniref:Uncharacterized protein n=1 Tax=Araneus ventricosus TaxID=182803 RepID=A0A4Y2JN54_ARAVE|nr:hypothetical protein AVEN_128320-1 [Araneus ventricosus]
MVRQLLWNRLNLDSSDRMALLHCSTFHSLYCLSIWGCFPQLIAETSGFLVGVQLFSSIPLSCSRIVSVDMPLCPVLSIAVSSRVDFLQFSLNQSSVPSS